MGCTGSKARGAADAGSGAERWQPAPGAAGRAADPRCGSAQHPEIADAPASPVRSGSSCPSAAAACRRRLPPPLPAAPAAVAADPLCARRLPALCPSADLLPQARSARLAMATAALASGAAAAAPQPCLHLACATRPLPAALIRAAMQAATGTSSAGGSSRRRAQVGRGGSPLPAQLRCARRPGSLALRRPAHPAASRLPCSLCSQQHRRTEPTGHGGQPYA